MSRLCRLKTASHGEDGKWAYEEITRLRARVQELEAGGEVVAVVDNDGYAMSWCGPRFGIGIAPGTPLYTAPQPADNVVKQRDELLAELLRVKKICLREVGIGVVNEVVIANVIGGEYKDRIDAAMKGQS